jgi:acetyl esterase/lipase
MIPKDAVWVKEWIDLSKSTPIPRINHIQKRFLDVPYGKDPLQKMDIYLPEKGKQPYKVFVLVHGGGFSACDKRDFHLYPGFFALREGYALVSLNYRLAPKSPFPAGLDDVEEALQWICVHAEEYDFDKNQLFLFGPSAGGNLVTLAGMDSTRFLDHLGKVAAVAALCPVVDLVHYLEQTKPMSLSWLYKFAVGLMMRNYFGKERKNLSLLEKASYMPYLSANVPPFFLQIGDMDPIIPLKQVTDLRDELVKTIGAENVELDLIPGGVHSGGDKNYYMEENVTRALHFFQKHSI